jgi:PAS domain S-box-containing protein
VVADMSERIVLNESIEYDGKPMLCETDLEGKITFVNRSFKTMVGYEIAEIVSQTFQLFSHPDVPQCLFSKMWTVLKDKEDWSGYLKFLTKEGKDFWASIYITPKVDESKNIIGYTAAFSGAEQSMIDNMSKLYAEAIEKELCSEVMVDDMNIANLAGH